MPEVFFSLPATVPILLLLTCAIALGWLWHRRVMRAQLNSAQISYHQALEDSYFIRQVVESTSDGLVVLTMDAKVVWANPAYSEMTGRSLEEIRGRNPLSFAIPKAERPDQAVIDNFRYEPLKNQTTKLELHKNVHKNGTEFWNQISISFRDTPDGEKRAILVCRDVTEQVERERELDTVRSELEFSAAHDDLTGISNRPALLAFTRNALTEAAATGRRIGMLRADLDKFKVINDTHGHPAGDAVLVHVAKAFKSMLRDTDIVARTGGDEFVIVCPEISDLDTLKEKAASISRAACRPFRWGDKTLSCDNSFGVALSSPGMLAPEELLQHSDFALYEVKRNGRGGVAAYDEDLHERHSRHIQRSTEFAQALKHRELTFFFQPTLNLIDGSISGFETLLRWQHPNEGLLTPDKILPLADELGLLAQVDLAAMDAGFAMKDRLRKAGYPDLRIGLNASADALIHPDYVSKLETLVGDYGFEPSQIAIEVLETVMLDSNSSSDTHTDVISRLHHKGFHTMLDDFGIGHAGLSHLAKLALTGVKIDRSLASRVLEDRTSSRIVRTVVELCDDLDLRLIAEGVETAEVASCLRDMGCAVMQGYWLSKPLPPDQVIPWLKNRVVMPLPYGPSATVEGEALPAIQPRPMFG